MAALDRFNQAFVEACAKEVTVPLHEQGYTQARQTLEKLQRHKPAEDIEQHEIEVPFEKSTVQTVIFRPRTSTEARLPVVFYTHGGGWIMGRYVPTHRSITDCPLRRSISISSC